MSIVKFSAVTILKAGLFGAIFLVGISGASGQVKPDAPRQGESPAPLSTSPIAPTPGKNPEGVGAAIDPNKYLIGPEDVLFVRTWREVDFTQAVAVRPDGKITMPLIGDLQAAGLTPLQLTVDLKDKLGKYINNPDVTVSVTEVRSKKYFIDGEVGRPGAYPLVSPTNVLEALSIASGFREFAKQNDIRILRGSKSFKFNYKDVIKGKHLEQNIYLENGDHVIVR